MRDEHNTARGVPASIAMNRREAEMAVRDLKLPIRWELKIGVGETVYMRSGFIHGSGTFGADGYNRLGWELDKAMRLVLRMIASMISRGDKP